MLSKKPQVDKVNTVIGLGTKMEGKLESKSSIRIDGEFKGEITTEGSVHIGKDGVIQGDIKAGSVTAEGHIDGNIQADNSIHMVNGCHVKGDITAQSVEIEKGAVFNGHSTMVEKSAKDKKHLGDKEKKVG